jgi:hypothetical protein
MNNEINKQAEIINLESNLYALKRYLKYIDNDRVNGWQRDVCLVEVQTRVNTMIRSYQKLFDA